jgi:hypothetical protein
MEDVVLRQQLAKVLDWHDAHSDFDQAVAGIPADRRGVAPYGLPYSPWQLVEHIRRTQADILEFCVNPEYRELEWPRDYWPESNAPESDAEWDAAVAQTKADCARLAGLAQDTRVDLGATVPAGNGQTFLREVLLVIDHTAYHVGQLVVLRRLLTES